MEFYRKHTRLFKFTTVIVVSSGIGWFASQIKKTHEILNNTVDTSIIFILEPPTQKNLATKDEGLLFKWLKNYQNSETTFGWNTLKFAYARRLLNMASNENRAVRLRAVKQLGKIKNLDNWHYSLLAHLLDAKTAIGLARTEGADFRYFSEAPLKHISYNHQMIVNTMKDFLVALNNKSNHPCMAYFISQAFADLQDVAKIHDHESASVELIKLINSSDDILPVCLESILHHSTIDNYAKDIVLLNGLPFLMEIYTRSSNNQDINITLCKILANISVHTEMLEDIYRTGWVTVLAEWVKDSDVRLSAPAARALANLDRDEHVNEMYSRRIYLLHPSIRTDDKIKADVVFVHGLLGGVFFTWRQGPCDDSFDYVANNRKNDSSATDGPINQIIKTSDPTTREYFEDLQDQKQLDWEQLGHDFEFVLNDVPVETNQHANGPYTCPGSHQCIKKGYIDQTSHTQCWPKDWLAQDCQNLRIIGVNYHTNLSMWARICPVECTKSTLDERSDELMRKLHKAGIGKRPIIWVTHSMGGLIVKNILCKAWERDEFKNMCLNTKGIVFYSTPHAGSRLANLRQATALVLWPSIEVTELKEESPGLLEIHNKFTELAKEVPMKVVSFVETKSTIVTAMKLNFVLVEPHSANPGIGEFFEIPQDHLSICKPSTRQSFLYQKVLHLIQDIIKESSKL